ncbi:hypothetical protein LOTGIDRAFT_237241 [Lottia gigantea]|uniref:Sushi domain-containing protein n=1 Tax=Lottia gigantea TaxID=225164 RepID=V4AKE9_LOTGI|nr:hypothetical protein LOTGIDRAFT_237241 [Lottia gigantea]ESP04674.1 hypothetical protein LOTGIDRAFT_237241 [Lottia gigantea]
MITNANLMLMGILLVGTLPVASPKLQSNMVKRLWGNNDCDKYILPIHTMWIPRESCEENKRFKCQSGYIPEVQTKCKNGAWYLDPTCRAVECPQGEKLTNSDSVTESRIFDEVFTFDCSVGYTKNGKAGILRCGENGTWTEQQACQVVECPQGVNITNSDTVTESRIFDQVFTFNCLNDINGLTGAQRCGEDGKWIEEQACPEVYREKGITIPSYNQVITTNCTEACLNDTRCSVSLATILGSCKLYEKPIFFIKPASNLPDCFQFCKNDIRCWTVFFQFSVCNLFSVNYTTLETVYSITDGGSGIIVSGFH